MNICCSPTNEQAGLDCKQVLQKLCDAGYYPVIIPCTSSPSSVLTDKLNKIIPEGFKPVILRMTNDSRLVVRSELEHKNHGLTYPKELLLHIIAHQVISAEEFLDSEAPRTCQCSVSGLIPTLSELEITPDDSIVESRSSKVQLTVIEGSNLKGFDCFPIKTSDIYPEPTVVTDDLEATVPANTHTVEHDNTSDVKQVSSTKAELSPSSPEYQGTTNIERDHFVDKHVVTSSEDTIQGEANLDRSLGNIENHAGHGALGVPLKENILRRAFKGLNSWKHRFWCSFCLFLMWLGEKLYFLGWNVGIPTGVLMFAIIGRGFPVSYQVSKNGPIASLEPKSIITHRFSLGSLNMTSGPRLDLCFKPELENDGIVLPKNMSSFIAQQVPPVEHISWEHRMNDSHDLDTCPRAFSGNHSTVMERQNSLTSNFEGSNSSLPRSYQECQEPQSVNGALVTTTHTGQPNNSCGIKQDEYHLKAKVQSSSHQKTEKTGNSSQAMFQGELNGDLVRRSKYNLLGVMDYVYSLKTNFWDLVTLLLLLADVFFGFVGWRPSIVIGVAISIILGVAISMFVLTSNNNLPPNPFQYDFPTLIYGLARSLMILSLVLQQIRREWLSHIMAGAAYSCAVLLIIGHNFSRIPLEFAYSGVSVFISLVLLAVYYRKRADRTDEVQ